MNGFKTTDKEKLVQEILRLIGTVRYGYIQIIIQDSKVVQIDKTEKVRLGRKGGDAKN